MYCSGETVALSGDGANTQERRSAGARGRIVSVWIKCGNKSFFNWDDAEFFER